MYQGVLILELSIIKTGTPLDFNVKASLGSWTRPYILTYNELDHSLPACLPACRYQLTSNTIATVGLEKRYGRLFGQYFFSSESL
jgi:hypothetical protein